MRLRRCCGMWLSLLGATITAGASDPPFQARHHPYEPQAPLLTAPDYLDVLRGAEITASSHTDEQRPEFVHDGVANDTVMFWTAQELPAWVRLSLPETRMVAEVDVQLRSPGARRFDLKLETSADEKNWQTIYTRGQNEGVIPEGKLRVILDTPVRLRELRLTITGASQPEAGGPYVMEISAYAAPTRNALEGAVGDIDHRYTAANVPMDSGGEDWQATAWRGERVHGQFVVWTKARRSGLRAEVSALRDADGHELPSDAAQARFVRSVLADGELTPDVLDDAERVDMSAGSYRAVWLTITPPRDAAPGSYTGKLTLRADGTEPKVFPLTLEVLPTTLPAPHDWKFHLDVWQHPWSIARWHGVQPWSEAHWQVMRPYLRELADAGQKVITTTITPQPWGSRDYDTYGTMVEHLRQPDGSWKFDYAVFDRYVEYAMSGGITAQINCYAMLTWSGRLYYTDAATGDTRWMMCDPRLPEYADYWGPFLRDFVKHLDAKGWLEITRLAVDEAPAEPMRAMMAVVHANAPQLKVALAGNRAPSHYAGLDLADFTIILDHASEDLLRDIGQRRAEGRVTTFYVCLDPKRPNTFVTSPPAESVWLGYYTAVNGYDGMLRWAFTTWPENPLHETLYSAHPWRRDLPPGDSFLVYPGPRSSIRWELLRDGIEEWVKLAVIRARHGGQLPPTVAAPLERFRDPKQLGDDATIIRDVEVMRAAVEEEARIMTAEMTRSK